MIYRRAIFWFLVASVFDAADTFAQPAQPEAPAPLADGEAKKKEEARDHFQRGLSLFDEETWDAALAEFARSRAIYPTRAATKNAALCLRRLKRFDEALDTSTVALPARAAGAFQLADADSGLSVEVALAGARDVLGEVAEGRGGERVRGGCGPATAVGAAGDGAGGEALHCAGGVGRGGRPLSCSGGSGVEQHGDDGHRAEKPHRQCALQRQGPCRGRIQPKRASRERRGV